MRIKNLCWLALSISVAACHLGQTASEWSVAKSAAGAIAKVRTGAGPFSAELLEVRDDGVVLLRQDRTVVFARFTALSSFEIPGLGLDYVLNDMRPLTADTRVRLARVSHFPQGMTAEARTRLLSAAGQKEVTVLQ